MSKRSKFFQAMTYFFTNDQNGQPPKKKPPAEKRKPKRNLDVPAVDHTLQVISKPKRRPPVITAEPKITKEVIDLTNDEDDLMLPIKIQILDESHNIGPILLHIKRDPVEDINSSSISQPSSPDKYIKNERSSDDVPEILSNNDCIIDNSILIDDMSIIEQTDPLENDDPLLLQHCNHDHFDLPRNENEDAGHVNKQVDEAEIESVDLTQERCSQRKKHKVNENSAAVYSQKKVEKKLTPTRKNQVFHLSKIITIEDSNSYYCALCERSIPTRKALTNHVRYYKAARAGYKCSLCDERFEWKGYLARHLKEHFTSADSDTTVESKEIKKEFGIETEPTSTSSPDKSSADNYETFNNLEKKLQSNSSWTHASLIKLICDTDIREINIACGYCDQRFSTQISLVEHCRTHVTDGSFICNICGMVFKQNSALVYHTRIHFRMIRRRKKKISAPFIRYVLKLHSCYDCNLSYVSWSALNQHRLSAHNSAVERFPCDVCDRVYYSAAPLNRHKQTCGKKQICEICGMSFPPKSFLRHQLSKHRSQC